MGEDVVVLPGKIDAREGAEEAHGDDEDDGEGEAPAFILGGEDEEDEEDAEREDIHDGVASEDLLEGEVGPLKGVAAGELFGGDPLDGGYHLPGGDAGEGVAVDVGTGEHVVALDAVGPADAFDVYQGAEGDHFPGAVASLKAGDVVGGVAKLGLGHGEDLVGAAEEVEVVHVHRAEGDLECLVDVGERDAEVFRSGAVDVHVELRGVGPEAGEHGGKAGLFGECIGKLAGGGFE